jgi:hypothetical protein
MCQQHRPRKLQYGRTYQVFEDTLVKLPLCRSTLPELLVVIVKAGPMLPEFRKTVLVDVFDSLQAPESAYAYVKHFQLRKSPNKPSSPSFLNSPNCS